jgi:hypothetical protein
MKKTFRTGLSALLFACSLGVSPLIAAEGDVGTQAFAWTGYKALDSVTHPNGVSLASFQGKVVLLVVFQYNCGGCVANAPKLGKLADSLGSGQSGIPFQAVGAEITNGSFAQIATYNTSLRQTAANVNFPLVRVPYDTGIETNVATLENRTRWKRYSAGRDVYFVINHNGVIVARIAGNRQNSMTAVKYDSLKTQLVAALAAVPVSVNSESLRRQAGLRVFQRGASFVFESATPVSIKIQDLQGRNVKAFTVRAGSFLWDGKNANGQPVPFGTYFVRAQDGNTSFTRRISLLP